MKATPPTSRNAPCPCGSGRHYENCHGAHWAQQEIRVLLAGALAAQEQGRLDDAEYLCKRILSGDPSNFNALHMLGVTHFKRQDYAGAHAMISSACALRPDIADAARNLLVVEGALRRVSALERYRSWVATVERATVAARAPLRSALASREIAPRLSVVMPVYNSAPRWLAACLESILAQEYTHWELCIADDASTDPASREVLANYAARDGRIRVIWRAMNGHISAASNSALELVTGEYVALLDHDDTLPPACARGGCARAE